MAQTFSPLTVNDLARIEAQRKWVRQHFTPDTESLYEHLDQKLRLLQTIIDAKWIDPTETVRLQSLGITLGDAFSQKTNLHWIMVEDEFGRDPALQFENTSLVVFPLTMISKRIERGESVNIADLFSGICAEIERLKYESDEIRT